MIIYSIILILATIIAVMGIMLWYEFESMKKSIDGLHDKMFRLAKGLNVKMWD